MQDIRETYSLTDSKDIPIDQKLTEIFNYKKNGFYIELGANTGLNQSNTALLEWKYSWTGILIEPSKWGYKECIKNRPKNIILNYACVDSDFNEEFVNGDFVDGHPMASVGAVRRTKDNEGYPPKQEQARAITMEKLLDEFLPEGQHIDFLSLDTEGYEYNILKGINFEKHSPTYLLIEVYYTDFDKIVELLERHNYTIHSCITNYNKEDNHRWDGLHNDFLFVKGQL